MFLVWKTNLDKDTKKLGWIATIDHIIPISKNGKRSDKSNCLV